MEMSPHLRQRRLQVQPAGGGGRSRAAKSRGTWSETSRNVGGNIQGRGANGSFQVVAQAAGFNASIALKTTGNKQQIAMKADSQFRAANISLSK